jgi:hypothetical protein
MKDTVYIIGGAIVLLVGIVALGAPFIYFANLWFEWWLR